VSRKRGRKKLYGEKSATLAAGKRGCSGHGQTEKQKVKYGVHEPGRGMLAPPRPKPNHSQGVKKVGNREPGYEVGKAEKVTSARSRVGKLRHGHGRLCAQTEHRPHHNKEDRWNEVTGEEGDHILGGGGQHRRG